MPVPLPHLLRLAARPADPADADLLDAFTRRRDDAAFAELVRRHGPVVYRVCRRVVGRAAADDAFQATFLVLATRAAAARRAGSVAGWLVGVAGRVARQFRRAEYRRARREAIAASPEEAAARADTDWLRVLDEELTRLPPRLRAPVVLCHLQGRTQEEAAAALGQSARTVRRRLAAACRLLRVRLERRGVIPAVAAGLAAHAGPAGAVPVGLAGRTAAVAVEYLTGGADPSAAPVALANGVATNMLTRKLAVVVTVAVLGFAALGVNLAGGQNPPPASSYPLVPAGAAPAQNADRNPFGPMPGAPRTGGSEYKFVATNGDRGPFEKAITEQGAAGWEFAGSERVRDEKAGANVLVLVFRKRPVAVRPEGTPFGATDPTARAIRGAGQEVRPEGATTGADRTTATAPAAGHSARFRLTHAKADETAKALDDLFRGTGVLAAPEAATNSVVVRAPAAEWMTNVRRAVELLDRAAPPAGRPTVITLGGVSAVEAVNLLGQLFPEATGARITADAQTNALHVSGPPAVVEQIQGICRRLDAGRLAPGNRP